MLDYKDIIIKHYALHMSGRQIAAAIGASKSGVNDFLKEFEQCESLSYPLPAGMQTATFRGQQGRISRPVEAILSGRL